MNLSRIGVGLIQNHFCKRESEWRFSHWSMSLVLDASKTIFVSTKIIQFVSTHPKLVLDASKTIFVNAKASDFFNIDL